MPIEIHLTITATAGGSWRLTCRAPGEEPARARLETTRVRRLRAELDALAAGHDDPRDALATLFESSAPVAGAFGAARGAARTHGAALLLVIETAVPAIAGLPWEGLGRSNPESRESIDELAVARVSPRPGKAPRIGAGLSTRVRLLADDSVAEQLRRRIDSTCIRHGLSPSAPPSVGVPPDHGLVLHLIVPPNRPDALHDLLGGAEVGSIAPHVDRAELVVQWLTGSGGPPAQGAQVTARLLDLGTRACLVPRFPLPVNSAGPFLDGLYGALAGGRSLADAVSAARRTLPVATRVTQGGVLTVSSVAAAASPILRGERWPEGWPMPGPEAAKMIESAYVQAERTSSGFLGVEHLALALLEAPPRTELVRLRYQFGARRRLLESRLGGWSPRRTEPLLPRPTARLRRLGPQLSVGFSPEDLWHLLLEQAGATVRVLLDEPRRTLKSSTALPDPELTEATHDTWREGDGPAVALEVLTGPEDGRVLLMRPGDALGRASGSRRAQHRLYDDTTLTDAALSRRHLVWRGEGHVRLEAAALFPRQEEGDLRLAAGQLLGLTRCTWLVGLSAELCRLAMSRTDDPDTPLDPIPSANDGPDSPFDPSFGPG